MMKTSNRTEPRGHPVALRLHGDEGSTLLLTIFFAALSIGLILVVASATTLYLERKRLLTLADGAALAAAESWSFDAVSVEGETLDVALDDAEVRAAVDTYLGLAATNLRDVALVEATADDGRSATVTLAALWHAPISSEFLPIAVPIEVTVTARSVFH